MNTIQCFKSKAGTSYDKAIKKHLSLLSKWNSMYAKVSELLGEEITRLAQSKDYFIIDPEELTNEETKKLFKKDGSIKQNTKKGKELFSKYKEAVVELGLSEFEEMSRINFIHGIMRVSHQQELSSFVTSDNEIYFKANFDLERKSGGNVEPITEIQFEEKYLEELKKQEAEKENK